MMCLIFGWLYVIHWTQFWKTVNHLSLVIHRIVSKTTDMNIYPLSFVYCMNKSTNRLSQLPVPDHFPRRIVFYTVMIHAGSFGSLQYISRLIFDGHLESMHVCVKCTFLHDIHYLDPNLLASLHKKNSTPSILLYTIIPYSY